MRATVAKRLRKLVAAMPASAWTKDNYLVHQVSDKKDKRHRTAVIAPDCGRHHYQQLKKEYIAGARHA